MSSSEIEAGWELLKEYSREDSTLSEKLGEDSISSAVLDDDFDQQLLRTTDLEDMEEQLGLGRGGWWLHPDRFGYPYDPHVSDELYPNRANVEDLQIWLQTPFNDEKVQEFSKNLINKLNTLAELDRSQPIKGMNHVLAPQLSSGKPPIHGTRKDSPGHVKGRPSQRRDTYLKSSGEKPFLKLQKPTFDNEESLNNSLEGLKFQRLARRDTFQLGGNGPKSSMQLSNATYEFGSLERSICDDTIAEEDEQTPGPKFINSRSPGIIKSNKGPQRTLLNPRRCASPDKSNYLYDNDQFLTRTYSNEALKILKDDDDVYNNESISLSRSLNFDNNRLNVPRNPIYTKNTTSNMSSLRSSQESIRDMAKSQEEQLRASVPDKYKRGSPTTSALGSQEDLRSSNPEFVQLKKSLMAAKELRDSNELKKSLEKENNFRKHSDRGLIDINPKGSYDLNKMNRSYDCNDPYMIARMQEESLRASSQGKYSSSRNSSNSSRTGSRDNMLSSQDLGDGTFRRPIDHAKAQEELLRSSVRDSTQKYKSSRDSSLHGSYDLSKKNSDSDKEGNRKVSTAYSENLFFGEGVEELIGRTSSSFNSDKPKTKHQLSVITAEALDMSTESNISQNLMLARQQEELLRNQTQQMLVKSSVRSGSQDSTRSSNERFGDVNVKKSYELQKPLNESYDLADKNLEGRFKGSQENINLRGSYELNKPKILGADEPEVKIREKPPAHSVNKSYDISKSQTKFPNTMQLGTKQTSRIPPPRSAVGGVSRIPKPGAGGNPPTKSKLPFVAPASPSKKLPTQSKQTNRYK